MLLRLLHETLTPWPWGAVLVAILLQTQITVLLVTVYCHRTVAHGALVLSRPAAATARFLSWWMLGMDPHAFAAVHRCHHATTDTDRDPHAPSRFGLPRVVLGGMGLYRRAAADPDIRHRHGRGLRVDPGHAWYTRHPNLGLGLQGLTWVALAGGQGLVIWIVGLLWIPFWAGGIVNGIGHRWGYRRYATPDASTNIVPWGVWLGGEELHNNHHADPASACFAHATGEVDAGWGVIRLLESMGLATRVRRPAHRSPVPNVPHALHARYTCINEFRRTVATVHARSWTWIPALENRLHDLLERRRAHAESWYAETTQWCADVLDACPQMMPFVHKWFPHATAVAT